MHLRKQARISLELKSQAVFEQAFELQERLAQQQEEKSKQRALCEQLANQVQKWREKQLEMLEMRRKLEDSKRQAELEKLQEENERFLKHRQQLKEKVSGRSADVSLSMLDLAGRVQLEKGRDSLGRRRKGATAYRRYAGESQWTEA